MVQLYEKYYHLGLEILAFPSNEFGKDEPGTNAYIKGFAAQETKKFGSPLARQFPVFAKSTTNKRCGQPASKGCRPQSTECCSKNDGIYRYLQAKLPGKVNWNYNKYLISRTGAVLKHYKPHHHGMHKDLVKDIEAALQQGATGGSGH